MASDEIKGMSVDDLVRLDRSFVLDLLGHRHLRDADEVRAALAEGHQERRARRRGGLGARDARVGLEDRRRTASSRAVRRALDTAEPPYLRRSSLNASGSCPKASRTCSCSEPAVDTPPVRRPAPGLPNNFPRGDNRNDPHSDSRVAPQAHARRPGRRPGRRRHHRWFRRELQRHRRPTPAPSPPASCRSATRPTRPSSPAPTCTPATPTDRHGERHEHRHAQRQLHALAGDRAARRQPRGRALLRASCS